MYDFSRLRDDQGTYLAWDHAGHCVEDRNHSGRAPRSRRVVEMVVDEKMLESERWILVIEIWTSGGALALGLQHGLGVETRGSSQPRQLSPEETRD